MSNTTEDIARIRTAFDVIIDTCEEWPPVAVFHKSLPPRKAQAQLPEYVTGKISDEVARENLRQIHKLIGLTTASSEVN